jgi:hypothetical protein
VNLIEASYSPFGFTDGFLHREVVKVGGAGIDDEDAWITDEDSFGSEVSIVRIAGLTVADDIKLEWHGG